MHFSKTYSQLLLDLPPQLRENAVQYRQLKKLINQIVLELASLGLTPRVLQELLAHSGKGKEKAQEVDAVLPDGYRVVYEVNEQRNRIEPCLHFWVDVPHPETLDSGASIEEVDEEAPASSREAGPPTTSLLWALSRRRVDRSVSTPANTSSSHELVIPLASDSAFFQMLSTALESTSQHLTSVQSEFSVTLAQLSRDISDSARPVSSTTPSFHPHSRLTHPGTIRAPAHAHKTDLNAWREIFQLYVEAEVFEGVGEASRGERTVEESELRLKQFAERVTTRGLGDNRQLKLKQSRMALETFLKLNMYILNIKKFQTANSEATRKILKKHAKRTALALPDSASGHERLALIMHAKAISFPRILVQAIGEMLLPVIPHLDDYACLICTAIAFKPIRLNCGHLFCVRCLVKMQKRGQGDCPMCRAPTVLVADKSNVDWALLNFMQDWFPDESRLKLKQNEKEAAEEELIELGIDPHQTCRVM
ncbi:hypothetical protein BDZ89DRAFT_1143956 [Hymenopellis radicata]|nr:hypothetical protein BDZ89DRAFT_1143956 [Hymenopellis radicata]